MNDCFFGMFLIMFITSTLAYTGKLSKLKAAKTNFLVSLLGILFAGYYVTIELWGWVEAGKITLYTLGLPTCAYGLVFYILIFVMSTKYKMSMKNQVQQ